MSPLLSSPLDSSPSLVDCGLSVACVLLIGFPAKSKLTMVSLLSRTSTKWNAPTLLMSLSGRATSATCPLQASACASLLASGSAMQQSSRVSSRNLSVSSMADAKCSAAIPDKSSPETLRLTSPRRTASQARRTTRLLCKLFISSLSCTSTLEAVMAKCWIVWLVFKAVEKRAIPTVPMGFSISQSSCKTSFEHKPSARLIAPTSPMWLWSKRSSFNTLFLQSKPPKALPAASPR
mmetsp:Transcript_100350/g.199070  ORF Transcript_100350/g.199070 Transcript_100350/m.199070 type:complete len:235 (-) Transcript_100350:787-1491(-)